MIERQKIIEYISKACNFLVKDQNKDGSWSMKHEKVKEPPTPYQNSLILTSQALQALIFGVKQEYVESIQKALNFCINEELNPEDPVDLWAWKYSALEFSNITKSVVLRKEILELLEEKQEENGCWPYYPNTFMLTNFSVINAIAKEANKETIQKAIDWFNNSKKGNAWSRDDKSKNVEPSFTANAVLSLIELGERIPKEVIEYIENNQKDNGGWEVLNDAGQWENVTSYSTALCTLALIKTNGNKEKIEKGIEYLLKCQDEHGRILRTPTEKETYHYLFYYVIKTLVNYLNLTDFNRKFLDSCYKHVLNSRAIGVTEKARKRRKDILKGLEEGDKTVAEIIDYLKVNGYEYLNKKSHITQIKSDVEYLRSIKLIGKKEEKYFISINLL